MNEPQQTDSSNRYAEPSPEQSPAQSPEPSLDPAKLASAVRLGKGIGWAVVVALVVLLCGWALLVKSPLRDGLVLGSAVVVAGLVLWGRLLRRSAGRPELRDVHRGLMASASAPSGAPEANTAYGRPLPGGFAGLQAWRVREALAAVAPFAVLLAPLMLGVGSPVLAGKAGDLVADGYVVRELRVESVRNVVEDEHKTGSTFFCTSTVTLPAAAGTGGRGTRAEFRSEWVDECTAGQRAYVAYSPESPQIGAIGDSERALVERQLDGRALSQWWTGMLALAALGAVALLIGNAVVARRDERFPRELQGDEYVVRTRITGLVGKRDGSHTVTLASDAGPVEFHPHAPCLALADAAEGATGALLWHPDRNPTGGRKGPNRIGAVFVSDDGWYAHGMLDPQVAQRASGAAAAQGAVSDGSYTARPLDLAAAWILSVPERVAQALVVWAGLLVLLALPLELPGRLILGIVGSAGLLVFGGVVGLMRQDEQEKALKQRADAANRA